MAAKVGHCLFEDGRYNEAGPIYLQVLNARREQLDGDDKELHESMSRMASAYYRQQNLDKAEELEVRVLEARKKALGDEHSATLQSKWSLEHRHIVRRGVGKRR